ncbi:hypothetical protein F5Y06DRAFT_300358 [Hypoxylon sp. FL0890]|nr:hypothetical protein F5Y06DRAFT_300358 [Hypoxylon sp. FL0890]
MSKSSRRQSRSSFSAARQEEADTPMPDVSRDGSPDRTARSPSLGNSSPVRAESPPPGYIKTPRGSSSSDSSASSFVSPPSPTPAPSTRHTNPLNTANRPRVPYQRLHRLAGTPDPGFGTPGGGFRHTATASGSPVLLGPPRPRPSMGSVYGSGSSVASRLRASVMRPADVSSPQTPPHAQTPTDEMPERRRRNRAPLRDRRISPDNPTHRRASDLFGSSTASRMGTPRDISEPLGWTPPSRKEPKGKGKGIGKETEEKKGKSEDKED